jgi:hypothetical protein
VRRVRPLVDLARCLGALTILAALLVAPPWLLTRYVGWPLPTVFNLTNMSHALGGPSITDGFLLKALAVACWMAWAQVVACATVEIVAWARGQAAGRVPLGGIVQPFVRQLVISGTMLLGMLRPAGAVSVRPLLPPVPIAFVAPAARASAPVVMGAPTHHPAAPAPTCVVRRRDSLWRLAERHLGDGLRWREIYDLNRGRPQPGGRTLTNPDLILPGWTLRLPEDATGLQPPHPAAAPPAAVAPTSPAVPPVPAPLPIIGPSPIVTTPAMPASPAPVTPGTTRPVRVEDASAPGHRPGVDDDDRYPVPAALAGATLLAAGVVATLRGLRRRQIRERRRGRSIPLPTGPPQAAERLIRAAAATGPANRLDLALRLLAHQLAQASDPDSTRIELVRVDGDSIEVLLTNPIDAPAGPFDQTDGIVWTLPVGGAGEELDCIASRQSSPAPALVSVGHLDGRQVLLDLETGPLLLTGDRERAGAFIWSIGLELATSAWADDLQVVAVGKPPDGLGLLDRIDVVDSVDEVIDEVTRSRTAFHGALDDAGEPSPWAARLAGAGDAWQPTIVLVSPDADAAGTESLPGDIGLVRWVDEAAASGGRVLHLGVDVDRLEPLGLDLEHAGLDDCLLGATAELLTVGLSDDSGDPLLPRDGTVHDAESGMPALHAVAPPVQAEGTSPDQKDPERVIVRVLGPVVIEGAKTHITRRRVKELIVYLALHPNGVTDEQIKTALWPGDTPTRAAFNQTVSRARAALGHTSAGEPYVPYLMAGKYVPGAHLTSDLTLLEALHARAGDLSPTEVALRLADLVNGEPFAGSNGFEWAYCEGIAYRATILIDELSGHSVGRPALDEPTDSTS